MTYALPLIDKVDGFEIVRDKIAEILATETVLQVALATAQGKDHPEDWALKVFKERINPWEEFVHADATTDPTPILNVWYDSEGYDKSSSNQSGRQKATSRINIDCLGYALSEDNPAGGHVPGDMSAALVSQRVVRLVRNILMSDKYKYLGLRGLVWRRWVAIQTAYQPQSGGQPVQKVQAVRVAMDIEHNETIEMPTEETVEQVNVKMRHEPNGQIIAEMDIIQP